jgi:hypothetical protein
MSHNILTPCPLSCERGQAHNDPSPTRFCRFGTAAKTSRPPLRRWQDDPDRDRPSIARVLAAGCTPNGGRRAAISRDKNSPIGAPKKLAELDKTIHKGTERGANPSRLCFSSSSMPAFLFEQVVTVLRDVSGDRVLLRFLNSRLRSYGKLVAAGDGKLKDLSRVDSAAGTCGAIHGILAVPSNH